MPKSVELWITLIAMGLVTYAIRLSLIGVLGRFEVPVVLQRALRLVLPAVLAAIILPALLINPVGELDVSPRNARLLAGLLAAAVAWKTKNVLATIAAGMVALWVILATGH